MTARVLVIDNYDSFVYTLVQYLGELGAEPLLPFDDVQVTQDSGGPGAPAGPGGPGPDGVGPSLGDYDLPYDTGENNPEPSATPNR